jgi:hypothetical protein
VCNEGREVDALHRMARVGFDDSVVGVLDGGLQAWKAAGMATDSFARHRWVSSGVARLLLLCHDAPLC